MSEEEVKKQEKRIDSFNKLSSELLPYKKVANCLTPELIKEGVYIGIGQTYGGDMYVSCTKNGHTLASVTIDYNEDLANQLIEIAAPIIFNKVKELEEKIEKI